LNQVSLRGAESLVFKAAPFAANVSDQGSGLTVMLCDGTLFKAGIIQNPWCFFKLINEETAEGFFLLP